jgi:hypothetical protein
VKTGQEKKLNRWLRELQHMLEKNSFTPLEREILLQMALRLEQQLLYLRLLRKGHLRSKVKSSVTFTKHSLKGSPQPSYVHQQLN